MSPVLHFLFGKLSATVEALKVETSHLAEEDEDSHKRLEKLVGQLDSVAVAMGEAELSPKPPEDSR